VYANGIGVWATQTEFTLDFLVNLPPSQPDPGAPSAGAVMELVARLKLPPPLVFQVLRNLSDALSRYEAQWGKIPDFQGSTIGRVEMLNPPSEEGDK